MACAVANEVIEIISHQKFLDGVKEKESLFLKLLSEFEVNKVFSAIRSSGLWIGCDLIERSANDVLNQAYDEGLILVSAGSNCLRLAPALNISNEEIEQGISILKKILLGR
jgi:acetylornithine/succinyldiaminopimelate/putrescine aminotransferase